jgi:hypothetical protein
VIFVEGTVSRGRRPGVVVALIAALATLVPAAPARAEDGDSYARSAATTYRVTFAARACGSYADVPAAEVRAEEGESPGRPGRDNTYKPGQAVDPDVESGAGCVAMAGVKFTLGSGREKKAALSTVSGAAEPVTTAADSPRLDPAGRLAGGPLPGSVTVILTADQVRLAARRQLWAQGGTPAAPLPGGHTFGGLRCAVDGRTGGNTQWIAFPAGVRHVFCFGYYVRGAAATGTLTVKLRTTRPAGYPQRVPFDSTLSQTGSFTLTAESAETSFVRLSGEAHRLQPRLPAGWRLADISCAASQASTDAGTGRTDITLIAGENATCAYAVEPPSAPAGLTIRGYAEGGAATFDLAVTGGPDPEYRLSVSPRDDGSAATASGADLSGLPAGTYTITVTPPATETALWSLAGAACNGAPATVQGLAVRAGVGAGVPTDCVLRLTRKQGAIALKVVTTGGVATAGFALLPAERPGPGWGAVATTAQPGPPAAATGDVPAGLPFGAYLLVPLPPLATVDASWRLTGLGCQPGNAAGADAKVVRVDLATASSTVECTATYQMIPATRLYLAVRADGGARGAAVVNIACADGSTGRIVLPPDVDGALDLPEPLTFAEKTNCTVSLDEASERPLAASLVVETGPGNAPLALPATVALDQSAEGQRGAEVRLAATLTYNSADGPDDGDGGALESFKVLPFALIGSGLIGIGAAVLLVLVARRRMGLD